MPGIRKETDMEFQDRKPDSCESAQLQTQPTPATPSAPRASRGDGGDDGVGKDAPSSNTASSSYKQGEEEGKIKILLKGIDSLYLSYQGEIDPAISQALADKKLFAQSRKAKDQAKAVWEVGKHRFEVHDKGQRSGSGGGFAYILEDAAYRILLAATSSRSLPMAYVKVSSAYLAHERPETIFKELKELMTSFGTVEAASLSRVDLFVDFQCNYDMESFPRQCWVTRAGSFNSHARGGHFTGYSIGLGGNISSRLYNKTEEIKKSQKTYFNELWKRGGADDRPIWRQEFEVHREILNELRILDFDSLMRQQGGIWAYATQTWLRLTIPQETDCNRARWPLHPLWQALSNVQWRLDDVPLIRRFSAARTPSVARICRFLLSYVTSFMALQRIRDFDTGASQLVLATRSQQEAHCVKYLGIGFDDWIEEQVAVKAKRFNLPFGEVSAREDGDRSLEDAQAAHDYYLASRGM